MLHMRSFAQNIQVEVLSNKLYCWKDGGKVSDFLWFLVHSFCDTLDFDDEGFCSLVTLIFSCGCQCWSTCPPLWSRPKRWWWCENTWISFDLFPNVHPIPQFQVPSYPSEQTSRGVEKWNRTTFWRLSCVISHRLCLRKQDVTGCF